MKQHRDRGRDGRSGKSFDEQFTHGPRQFSGGGPRGGFRSGGGPGGDFRQDREMHKAICADCGKECEVPFKPTEGRPVYCRDCFQKHRPPRF
ncbi:hypothetical protein JXB02_06640 [Candidatus Woesearchaeota archaeon]|nr:hypothetical protein [Candidatus Woesearchaeota archaeon]